MKKTILIATVALAMTATACGSTAAASSTVSEAASEATSVVSSVVSEVTSVASAEEAAVDTEAKYTAEEVAAYDALLDKKFNDQHGNEWVFNIDNSFSGTVAGENIEGSFDIEGDDLGAELTITFDGDAIPEGVITIDGTTVTITPAEGEAQVLTPVE